MWFDEEGSGRRRSGGRNGRRSGSTLKLDVRASAGSRVRRQRTGVMLMVPLAAVLIVLVAWLGVRLAGAQLFSRNPRFSISSLEIVGDRVVTPDFIRGKSGITEGSNLFGFDMLQVRESFLKAAPNFKSMQITRELPGTLKVEVTPRTPIAQLGSRRGFVVDAEGVIFGQSGAEKALPVIFGYRGQRLQPGESLQPGLAADAILLLDTYEKMGLHREALVSAVNVAGNVGGRDDTIQLYVNGRTLVDISWNRRPPKGTTPAADLRDRLQYLAALVRRAREQGRELRTVNLALDTYKSNVPITPQWN